MKIRLFLISMGFLFGISSIDTSVKKPLYLVHLKGLIQAIPGQSLDEYTIYYQGKETQNDEKGFFTILFETPILPQPLPSILICKKQMLHFESKNTLLKSEPMPEKIYKYFEPQSDGSWKENNEMNGEKVPENCVTILMNPKIVKNVETWEQPIEEIIKGPVLKLPKIILEPTLPIETLKKASLKSLNAGLDEAKFHERSASNTVVTKTPRGGTTLITLPQ